MEIDDSFKFSKSLEKGLKTRSVMDGYIYVLFLKKIENTQHSTRLSPENDVDILPGALCVALRVI